MKVEVLGDAGSVARRAAEIIAADARAAVHARGRFVFATSGGRTPWAMLRALSALDVPWDSVHVLQVDERIAPGGHVDRNLTHISASLAAAGGEIPQHIHPMPVEAADLDQGVQRYGRALEELAGSPPILDLVHLGLGADGHTASLVPGDAVLDVANADVALTGPYEGRRRMTLTYPVLNRARRVLWVITGEEKAAPLARLAAADVTVPAGRVRQDHAVVVADRAAARQLDANRLKTL